MTCRWDSDAGDYLADGEPCRTDEYGDPTRHCTSRRTCSNHIGHGELTCARCIGRTRMDLRRIVELAPLAMIQALTVGVDSEAANLAGPAADVEAWSWRKVTAKQGLVWHVSLVEDDDDFHPYTVLTRWEFMLREDYDQRREDATSIASAGAYLERTLARMAQDEGQDFPLFAREVRACRNHLDAVLRNSSAPTKGAPCPDCRDVGKVVRLELVFGHYCERPECQQQFHFTDDAGDRWVCAADKAHWMTPEGYAEWLKERTKVGA